jgi:hypothetical protein
VLSFFKNFSPLLIPMLNIPKEHAGIIKDPDKIDMRWDTNRDLKRLAQNENNSLKGRLGKI